MKRSLSGTGGPSARSGDPSAARLLAECLDVDPDAKLIFTHGFHTYPARMHPETARRAIERFGGGRVLDPFVGSGTTALEALRAGLPFTGIDVSRVAIEIAWIRTRAWKPDRCREVERDGHAVAARAPKFHLEEVVLPKWALAEQSWFAPHTLREIVLLRALLDDLETAEVRRALIVVLSSIIVKLSRQSSDSVTIADGSARPWPPRATFNFFREKSSELTKSLLLLSSDLYKRKVKPVEPDLLVADARDARPARAALLLTSPPYPGVYDYSRHHRLRFPLFGDDGVFAEKHEIGSRRDEAARYAADLTACLLHAAADRAVLLIGDNAGIRADAVMRQIAPALGGRLVAMASQDRREVAFGRRGLVKREHLVLIERPATPDPRLATSG
jgi:hypothetical protein